MTFSPVLGPNIPVLEPAQRPPPTKTWVFFRWAVLGASRRIIWAAFWSVLMGSLEAISATLPGRIVDAAAATSPADMAQDLWPLFAVFAVYDLLIRPIILGMGTAAASIRLEPNLFPLILSRMHRRTLGQAVNFFDNDFAGSG